MVYPKHLSYLMKKIITNSFTKFFLSSKKEFCEKKNYLTFAISINVIWILYFCPVLCKGFFNFWRFPANII